MWLLCVCLFVFPAAQASQDEVGVELIPQVSGSLVVILQEGRLEERIVTLAQKLGWTKVVWNNAFDYELIGTVRFKAASLQDALRQLLDDYPLQAVFYHKNRVIVIEARVL